MGQSPLHGGAGGALLLSPGLRTRPTEGNYEQYT